MSEPLTTHQPHHKERPILFSGEMVRAILDGRKTQTRRVVKNPEYFGCFTGDCPHGDQALCDAAIGDFAKTNCPYGVIGDRLWVREACRGEELENGEDGVRYMADNGWEIIPNNARAAMKWLRLHNYRKSQNAVVPSIHMPRWASRINLEITNVRVQRLRDISKEDAISEGLSPGLFGGTYRAPGFALDRDAIGAYEAVWESINGKGSWERNPWVWAITFKRLTP
jgi:hypothetical protein